MDFEHFYINWYSRAKCFAREYVLSEEDAENITQDVFLDLYQKQTLFNGQINQVAYLFTLLRINVLIISVINYWNKRWLKRCKKSSICLCG